MIKLKLVEDGIFNMSIFISNRISVEKLNFFEDLIMPMFRVLEF